MTDEIERCRAALRARPDDWRLALELKRALKAALHYPESDPLFRRAARALPDAEWLAHYSALYAYHGEDLDTLDARVRTMLERRPDDLALLAVLADVAMQRRDWATAEAVHPAPEKRALAAMYRALAPLLEPSFSGQPAAAAIRYAISFINLDRNPERDVELRRQFSGSAAPLHRCAGIEGRRRGAGWRRPAHARHPRLLPQPRRRLGGDARPRRRALPVRRGRRHPVARPPGQPPCPSAAARLRPPFRQRAFAARTVERANDRSAPPLPPAATTAFTVHSLAAAMALFPPDDNAPGGDGYVLSRRGAQKLLAWVAEDGFAEDVDWRLIAYGLSPAEIAALPRPSHAGPWLDRIGQMVRRPDRLAAYVLHPPLIRTVGVSSDREDENRLHPPP